MSLVHAEAEKNIKTVMVEDYNENIDYGFLDSLIDSGFPFAIYKLPGKEEVNLIMQKDNNIETILNIEDIFKYKGFIMNPFIASEKTPSVCIKPDFYIKGIEDIKTFTSFFLIDNKSVKKEDTENKITGNAFDNFEVYEKKFDTFHKALINKEFEKLVLSRAVDVEKPSVSPVGVIFGRAVDAYRNAFVYLSNTSLTGTWLGCSPEALLTDINGEWETTSVAGTRRAETKKSDWDEKNIREHHIVASYMEKTLNNLKINYKKGDSYTTGAGNIEHYKTDFTFKLDSCEEAGKLLNRLHPTPAVSGFPRDEAIQFILNHENQDRLYYTGFNGPVNINNASSLFVNIRCMQVFSDKLRLYAGGGMIESSNLKDEWNETEYKLQTLLSLFLTK
jgi:isochorismate synthase